MFQPAFIKSVENCRAHSFWQRKFMKRIEEEKTFARRKSALFLPLATPLPLPRRWYGFPLQGRIQGEGAGGAHPPPWADLRPLSN